MGALVTTALQRDTIEVVREFAIPLQSRALAFLLNMPQAEAETWIGWGTHIFREGDGTSKGAALETYTNRLLDRAAAAPGAERSTVSFSRRCVNPCGDITMRVLPSSHSVFSPSTTCPVAGSVRTASAMLINYPSPGSPGPPVLLS